MITQKQLKYWLDYNSETGDFVWLNRPSPRVKIGGIAGCITKDYIMIRLETKLYPAHCLAWLYMTGEWRINFIDHKDNNKQNNKWNNLRLATAMQNSHNQGMRSNNTTGIKGVTYSKTRNKYVAQITHNYKAKNLGYFVNIEDAAEAYRKAAEEKFGEYANPIKKAMTI